MAELGAVGEVVGDSGWQSWVLVGEVVGDSWRQSTTSAVANGGQQHMCN